MNQPAPSTASSAEIRDLVVEAVQSAAIFMTRPSVEEKWDQPSALEGMTVGALSAHLVRAAGATIAYLDRTPVAQRPEDELLTPVTYLLALASIGPRPTRWDQPSSLRY